jgi:hypothetical protein
MKLKQKNNIIEIFFEKNYLEGIKPIAGKVL